MRLYDSRGPNPQIVRTFIAEKGIEIDRVAVDVMKGENREAAYLAKNPYGQVPALELDNGTVITEVVAICELLEELYPQPALIGNDSAERAETRMWSRRVDLAILEPFMAGFRATSARAFFAPRMPLLSESAGAEVITLLQGNLKQLDTLMEGRTWICGERFSLPDILLGAFVGFAKATGTDMTQGLAWMPGWLDRYSARSSASA
jgi:glutathione S-transferase